METKASTVLTIEDALQKLGGFSWFQVIAAMAILFGEIPCSLIATMPVFTGTSNVPFICQQNSSRLLSGLDTAICGSNCTVALSGDQPVASIVQEWMLVCNRAWISDLFTSIQMAGMTFGSLIASHVADAYGRKKTWCAMATGMGLSTLASGLVKDLYLAEVTRFFMGMSLGGFNVVYFIFLMEFLTPKWRMLAGCFTIWSIGVMTLALFAYLLPSWRHLTWAASAAAFIAAGFYPLIPETPSWLLCKGKTDEAGKTFSRIARLNNKPDLTPEELNSLQKIVLLEQKVQNSSKQSSWELYRNSKLRYKLLLFCFGWFSVALVYYCISYNTKNLAGNPVLNVLYLGMVDLPAFPAGMFFSNWIGRRKTYAGFLTLSTVFLVGIVITDLAYGIQKDPHLLPILCYLSRFGISAAWGVVSCFTAESFPTVCRTTALGICALFAYLGGVVAPQLVYLGTVSASAPYFIFAGLILTTAFSSWLLPETNEKRLENFVSQ